jgi:putative FmdB family regulatory protein
LVVPIYEYECGSCGDEHEVIQAMSASPLRKCPACGRLKLRRKISRSAFHLKGEGWYVTDYNKNEKKESENGDKEAGADKESKVDGESDSAVKSDTKPKAESNSGGEKKKVESKKVKSKAAD